MKKGFILLLLIVLATSCDKDDKTESQKVVADHLQEKFDLTKEVVETPPSIVRITADLDIKFRNPVIPAHLQDTVLDENPFKFEPEIPGQAKWISRRILRYIPDENLPAGQNLKGRLIGKVAFGQQRNVNDLLFNFRVAEQEVLSLEGDFAAVPGKKNVVQYRGTIAFAQPVDLQNIRDDIEFLGQSGKLALEVAQQQRDRITIASEELTRKLIGQNFKVLLPAKFTADNQVWEKPLFLPGIGVFRVMAHMDASSPEAEQLVYAFRFNDPIKTNTDLSGYVTIAPELPFVVRAKGKRLLLEGNFDPGHQYEAKIAKGFPCEFGTATDGEYSAKFSFNNVKPEVTWLSPGVYLPTDNQFKLQFKSVNVRHVTVRVTEIHPQNIGFFIQTNALRDISKDHNDPYSAPSYQDLSRVGKSIYNQKIDLDGQKNSWEKTELDLGPVFRDKKNTAFVVNLDFGTDDLFGPCSNARDNLKENDLYFDSDNYYDNPCSGGYYYSRGHLTRLLISSNIGLTLKSAEDGRHVFATNVLSARPAKGLTLSLFSYQNELLETQTTDSDGHALFSKQGAYILGQDDSGIALIKTNHTEWQLNNFDVGGSTGGQKGTDVFIYADRGVHRPGDTIHLSAIVRMDRKAPPEKAPVQIKIHNPKGQIVHEAKTNAGDNGHVYFPIETETSDPTGNWRAEITAGGQTFSKTLKVETVKPNRLKIQMDLPEKVMPNEKQLAGTIETKYLFGAPAANLKARIQIIFSAMNFQPAEFADYTFFSPVRKYDYRSQTAFDGYLDAQGIHNLNYTLPGMSKVPSLLQAVVHTTVYEKGGNFVEKRAPVTIYPFSAYVGIKNIFSYGRARVGQTLDIPFVALDAEGNPVSGHKLKVKIYHNRYYWWWHYDERDQQDYRKMRDTNLIEEFTYTSQATPQTHRFVVEDYGNHFVEITDETSGHSAGIFFWTSYWGRDAKPEEQERNYLQITSNKNVYTIGDKAELTFDTPQTGMALLSLEQGSKIIRQEWKEVEGPQTSFDFEITDELIPNCYASISLIQPHNQNTNDLPMRLYGIKTVFVEEPSTHLPLALDAPDELTPKEDFTVSVTSNGARTGTFTIAIVDEGLLDLTDFETPSPWAHYFKKLRLGVQTRDNFEDIIGVLFPDIDQYFSIGGGFSNAQRSKRVERTEVKRFKPVVMFQEPVSIKPGETKRKTFTMPNYVGAVRIMVVGTAGHSYTSLDKTVAVKQPLMILTTLPRVARPGDIFDLPVSVFAMDSSVSNVNLTLRTSPNLQPRGSTSRTVAFTKMGEKDVTFSVAAGGAVGTDSATVTARDGNLKADYTVKLPVISPNPFYTQVTDTVIFKGQKLTLEPKKIGVEGTNKARIAFSRMPDINLDQRLRYLIRYPYGCIEQTTSSVFPQLYLTYLQELSPSDKQKITENINAGIKRLNHFKMSGGFSYWPGSHHVDAYSEWGTNYAGHFLLEAKALGYHVPDDLYNHWVNSATRAAKRVNENNFRYQTYRLYLLALAGKPHIGAMNLVRENHLNVLDPLSRTLLAAAYYLSNQKDIARQVEEGISVEIPDYRELSGTYGSALRDQAMITYLLLRMEKLNPAGQLLAGVTKRFNQYSWWSTQETSMALLALGVYYKQVPFTGGSVKFRVKVPDEGWQKMSLDGYQQVLPLEDAWGEKIEIEQNNDNPLFVTLFEEGVPLESRIKTSHNGIELHRNFYDDEGQPITATERLQGKPFWVVYKVNSKYGQPLEELALSSIFPAGWEIVNTRLSGEALPDWVRNAISGTPEYVDIRDDRVNWFFDLNGYGLMSFAVKINPTFKGTFTLPPVVCEAMYSPEFYAHIAGGKVGVK